MTKGLRILHTADLHIGRTLFGRSLKEDQQHILAQIVEIARDEKVDVAVIAGDLFDRAVPSAEAVQIAGVFLAELRQAAECPIIVIAGNHDSPERLDFLSGFLSRQGLHIRGALDLKLPSLHLSKNGTTLEFYPIPFAEPLAVAYQLGLDSLHDHQAAWDAMVPSFLNGEGLPAPLNLEGSAPPQKPGPATRQTVAQKSVAKDRHIRILVAHCYVAGGTAGDSERPLSIGGSELVSSHTFKDFDLVMLGHLHRPQRIAANIRYSGSPLALGAAEQGQQKQVLVYDIDTSLAGDGLFADQAVVVREIGLAPLRKLTLITGSFDELLSQGNQDYIIARLEEKLPVFDAFARLQQRFPNLLHLEYADDSGDTTLDGVERRREALAAGENAIVRAFIEDMTGQPVAPEDLLIIEEVMREIERERRTGDASAQT